MSNRMALYCRLQRSFVLAIVSLAASSCLASGKVEDLIVQSVRENPPRTSVEALRTVQTMLNINRADLALKYLQPLIDRQLSDPEMESLNQRFGAGFFLRLMREPGLDGPGDDFAIAVFEGASRAARDPGRVKALVQQLLTANERGAPILIDQLLAAGPTATAELLTTVANQPSLGSEIRQRFITAISLGGLDAVPVVEAGIDSTNEAVALAAMAAARALLPEQPQLRFAVLSRFHAPDAPLLQQVAQQLANDYFGSSVGTIDVGCWLYEETSRLLDLTTTVENQQEVWFWSPKSQRFTSHSVSAESAKYFRALRLARHLYNHRPAHADAVTMYLVAASGLAKRDAGLNKPLELMANDVLVSGALQQVAFINARTSEAAMLAALDWATTHNATAGALGILDLMASRTGDGAGWLQSPHGTPSTLAAALRHPNRRIRWAAAETIMALEPQNPYKGACDLANVYKQATHAAGNRVALVIDPNRRRAVTVAGNLNGLGYTAVAVRSGTEAMKLVVSEPDLELILISPQTYDPTFADMLTALRNDFRTKLLPLAVVGDGLTAAQTALTEKYPRIVRYPYPLDFNSAAVLVHRLEQLADADDLDAIERQFFANTAIARLAQMSARTGSLAFYDLSDVMVSSGTIPLDAASSPVIELWSNLGTTEAQLMLLRLSQDQQRNPELRLTAANALERSFQRFGINLPMPELANVAVSIHEQNLAVPTDSLDGPTQRLLDVLERASLEQSGG